MGKIIFESCRLDEEIIKEVIKSGQAKKNCIYGCGDIGLLLKDFLQENSIKTDFFLIDDEYYISPFCQELPVLKLSEIKKKKEEMNIFIGFANVSKALDKLSEINKQHKIYCIANPCGYLKKYDINAEYYHMHLAEFEKSFKLLEDDLSRDIFVAYLNTRINLNYKYMLPFGGCRTYFGNELFELSNDEIYVDCGAFDGDSVKAFINSVKNSYKKIYAIEPDKINFKKIEQFIRKEQLTNIELINKGVWKCKDKLGFSETGNQENTMVQGKSANFLEVDSLNNILKDKDVTIIKMSVQGCEEEALLGADKILKDKAPNLAVTIFMKPDALIKLPCIIKKINPQYKIYLRCEEAFFARVILYAKVDK
ncbi:MAG: FkbM family methyltransferase [Lachnospiraceae bacterium]|nr:FkbM family methyltransferase [Lachnospiraceae bacterium]